MHKKKPGVGQTPRGTTAPELEAQAVAAAAGAASAEPSGAVSDTGELVEGMPAAAGVLAELPGEAVRRLEEEAAQWKDRCLRAAAELENFKKRAVRERLEARSRAQAEVILRTLDVVDDLSRVAALDPGQTTAQALHEGMGLVERKLIKALEDVGLERVDPAGQPFDPNLHEAVMTLAAPSREADHSVASVLQLGYRLNGMLLRPARVAVYVWTDPSAQGAAETPQ